MTGRFCPDNMAETSAKIAALDEIAPPQSAQK
jgi:hypothetical protein